MTQVEAFWAGPCLAPWGFRGASRMGKHSVVQKMPPHAKCQQACQRGLGAVRWLHRRPQAPPVFGAASFVSLTRLSGWGWGQESLYCCSPIGSFIPQIFFEHLLCAWPYIELKGQFRHKSLSSWTQIVKPAVRTEETIRKTRAWLLVGRGSHILDFIWHDL